MKSPIPATEAIARHRPTSRIARYDEETCDGRLSDGTRTITLLNLMDDGIMVVAPAHAVDIITYKEDS